MPKQSVGFIDQPSSAKRHKSFALQTVPPTEPFLAKCDSTKAMKDFQGSPSQPPQMLRHPADQLLMKGVEPPAWMLTPKAPMATVLPGPGTPVSLTSRQMRLVSLSARSAG